MSHSLFCYVGIKKEKHTMNATNSLTSQFHGWTNKNGLSVLFEFMVKTARCN